MKFQSTFTKLKILPSPLFNKLGLLSGTIIPFPVYNVCFTYTLCYPCALSFVLSYNVNTNIKVKQRIRLADTQTIFTKTSSFFSVLSPHSYESIIVKIIRLSMWVQEQISVCLMSKSLLQTLT